MASKQTRIILHLNEGSTGILALRAASRLLREGDASAIFTYEDGTVVLAARSRTGVVAREAN